MYLVSARVVTVYSCTARNSSPICQYGLWYIIIATIKTDGMVTLRAIMWLSAALTRPAASLVGPYFELVGTVIILMGGHGSRWPSICAGGSRRERDPTREARTDPRYAVLTGGGEGDAQAVKRDNPRAAEAEQVGCNFHFAVHVSGCRCRWWWWAKHILLVNKWAATPFECQW